MYSHIHIYSRKPQPTKTRSCGVQSQWLHLQNSPTAKAQGTFGKRGRKDSKSQTAGIFAVRLFLLITPEVMPVKQQQKKSS